MILSQLRRYLGLSSADRRLFHRALIALLRVDLALRRGRFRELSDQLEPSLTGRRSVSPEDVGRARRYARWIEIASRHHVVRTDCLHRALVLNSWLRAEGLPSVVRIGVRKEESSLQAHAWVELDHIVVDDAFAAVAAFAPLNRSRMHNAAHRGTTE